MKRARLQLFLSLFFFCTMYSAYAQTANLSQSETVYVPAYSSILYSDLKWSFYLSVTLSIHNVDLNNNLIIDVIDYYNTSGKLLESYQTNTNIVLKPMETYYLGIKETDGRGGIGANFIVKWHAQSKMNRPLIETIMIGTREQQGISFTSRGVPVSE